MLKQKAKYNIVDFALAFLIIWSYWGFISKETVFESKLLLYGGLLILMALFSLVFVKGLRKSNKPENLPFIFLWVPFLLWRAFGYLVGGEPAHFVYYVICFVLLFDAYKIEIYKHIPVKLMLGSAAIVAVGIYIQLLLPSIYSSYILPYFNDFRVQLLTNWQEGEYGLSGFMCQLDRAAMPLLWAEGLLLTIVKPACRRKSLLYLIILFVIITIFLTGKRMASLVAVAAPFIVPFFSARIGKKIKIVVVASVAFFMLFIVFINNLSTFANAVGVGRLVEAYEAYLANEDVTSNRTDLNAVAIKNFESSPIVGVGVMNYGSDVDEGMAAHNIYLQVLAEQGLLGIILFIIPILIFVSETIRRIRRYNKDQAIGPPLRFSLFCQIVFILCGITENGISDLFVYMIYFMGLAIMISCGSSKKNQQLCTA